MKENKNFTVSVAINTFNRPKDLWDCLDALSRQTYKDFDVVIVNGGDRKPVEEIVKRFDLSVKIVHQIKKGLVEARNLCWREANTDIICIIDDDLVVTENWLQEIRNTFLKSEQIGGVSGPTLIDERRAGNRDSISFIKKFRQGNILMRIMGKFYFDFILEGKIREVGRILDCGTFTLGSNFIDSTKIDRLAEVDYLEACHMCMRRDLIEKAGGFDYCFTGTSEWSEPDLAFKINKLGYKLVFNPKAITEHRVSQLGVYKARTYAFERSTNFINFYFRHIKPNNLRKFIRFYSFLLFMNCYWIYKAASSRNLNWLTGISGTIVGLGKNIFI